MKFILLVSTILVCTLALEIEEHYINQKFEAAQGLLYTIPNDTLQLGIVDTKTGEIYNYGPIYSHLVVSEQLTALDYINEIFYAVTQDITEPLHPIVTLTGLDLGSGSLVSQIKLPFVGGAVFIGAGQGLDVDPVSGDVFVFGQETEFGPHKLLRVNPVLQTIRNVTELEGLTSLGGITAYDPNSKTYWVEVVSNYSVALVGIDVTKNGTDAITFTLDEGYDYETLLYDSVTKQLFGLAIVGSGETAYRVLLVLSSKTGKIREVGKVENYSKIYSGECALDWINRTIYAIMQPGPPNNKIPFDLVGINLKNGEVISKPEICQESCPWGLEFYNKDPKKIV